MLKDRKQLPVTNLGAFLHPASPSLKGRANEMNGKRPLEDRIVICADCDANRTLTATSSGHLVCSTCGSDHWMFAWVPIGLKFHEYDEREVQERLAIDRYIAWLEREEFFIPSREPL